MTSRQSGWHRPDSWGVGVSWLRHRTAVWQVISAQRGGVPRWGSGPPYSSAPAFPLARTGESLGLSVLPAYDDQPVRRHS